MTEFGNAYYYNMYRRQVASDKIFSRNRSDADLEKLISFRPSKTRQVDYPMLDCVKEPKEQILKTPKYNVSLNFNPSAKGPYSGYNVDLETQLANRNTPLQKCVQNKYIPNSSSDLYNNEYLTPLKYFGQEQLTQRIEKFDSFNPNQCRIGVGLFNNHTRQQTKDVKLE